MIPKDIGFFQFIADKGLPDLDEPSFCKHRIGGYFRTVYEKKGLWCRGETSMESWTCPVEDYKRCPVYKRTLLLLMEYKL